MGIPFWTALEERPNLGSVRPLLVRSDHRQVYWKHGLQPLLNLHWAGKNEVQDPRAFTPKEQLVMVDLFPGLSSYILTRFQCPVLS